LLRTFRKQPRDNILRNAEVLLRNGVERFIRELLLCGFSPLLSRSVRIQHQPLHDSGIRSDDTTPRKQGVTQRGIVTVLPSAERSGISAAACFSWEQLFNPIRNLLLREIPMHA